MTTNTAYTKIMQSGLFRLNGEEIDLLDAIQSLCDCISDDTNETDLSLGELSECCLADFIVGAYWALAEWHGGQYSETYSVLCSIGDIFDPGMTSLDQDGPEKYAYDLICEWLSKNV